MSIMNLFTKAPAAPSVVAPAPPAPVVAAPAPPVSPLDAHSKLWENDPTKPAPAPAALFDIDPAKLQEAIKSADFTKTVPPELLKAAQTGDAAAMTAVLNMVAQQSFSHQTLATTKLIEQALAKRDAELLGKMPEIVRQRQIADTLAANPVFAHEASRPLMDALQAQLTKQNPKASAAQIAEQAQSYIAAFASVAAGTDVASIASSTKSKADSSGTNFASWID